MAKEVRIELPDETYDQLLQIAKTGEGVAQEIVAAVQARLAEQKKARGRSILSIVGLGEGEPGLSESIDDILYGPRTC